MHMLKSCQLKYQSWKEGLGTCNSSKDSSENFQNEMRKFKHRRATAKYVYELWTLPQGKRVSAMCLSGFSPRGFFQRYQLVLGDMIGQEVGLKSQNLQSKQLPGSHLLIPLADAWEQLHRHARQAHRRRLHQRIARARHATLQNLLRIVKKSYEFIRINSKVIYKTREVPVL